MLNRFFLRIVYAVISATILSIIGNYLSSKLERVPRMLRDGRSTGTDQKTKKKQKENEQNRRKPIGASRRSGKGGRPRNSAITGRRKKTESRAEQIRGKGSAEKKGQGPKSQGRNRSNGAR